MHENLRQIVMTTLRHRQAQHRLCYGLLFPNGIEEVADAITSALGSDMMSDDEIIDAIEEIVVSIEGPLYRAKQEAYIWGMRDA